MKRHKITFRLKVHNYQKLIKYQQQYRLTFHKNISLSNIINGLINHNMDLKTLPPNLINRIQNRFNNYHYKLLLNREIKVQNKLNQIRIDIIGGLNNLNQIAHKFNEASNNDELDKLINFYGFHTSFTNLHDQFNKYLKQLIKLTKEMNNYEE